MQQLTYIIGVNSFVSLGLFLVLTLGTSVIPYFFDISVDFSSKTFPIRGGLFEQICVVFLILFTIFAFWYAIGYKKLEIMCIHLDGKLEGAVEVNEAAQRDNFRWYVRLAVTKIKSDNGKKQRLERRKEGSSWNESER